MATEYPRTRYNVGMVIAAVRRAVGDPHQQRLSDPGDLRGAANLGWSECVQRWQSDRASLGTYAWPRMEGRVRDAQRSERRQRQLVKYYTQEMHCVDTSRTPSWTEPLALRQAIDQTKHEMTPAERAILQRVYRQGGTLVEAAIDCGVSTDSVSRAHHRLLSRLRAAAGVPEPKQKAVPPQERPDHAEFDWEGKAAVATALQDSPEAGSETAGAEQEGAAP